MSPPSVFTHIQVTGKCGSVIVRLIPAPRGTGIVAASVPKKLLQMAGVSDCYTSARGQTATLGNFGESLLHYSPLSSPYPSSSCRTAEYTGL